MSTSNPYEAPQSADPVFATGPKRVSIRPFELYQRGYQLLGDQYWLFVVFAFLSIIVSSFVPFGLLTGAVMVGLFQCLLQRELGNKFDLNTLFRGFDNFLDSLIAMIIMIVANLLLAGPVIVIFLIAFFANIQANKQPDPVLLFGSVFLFWIGMMFVAFISYLPFMFCFQLLADRKVTALESVKLSATAVKNNLGGIILLVITSGIISIFLVLMCYLPVFLFMPIWISSMFVVYRDIFPEATVEAQVLPPQ